MITILGLQINIYAAALILIIAIFFIAIYKAQHADRFDWMDMIAPDGKHVQTTKLLQLIGGIVGTFIVIKLTFQGQLNWDIFAIYLGYAASVDGFSELIRAKYSAGQFPQYRQYGEWNNNDQDNEQSSNPKDYTPAQLNGSAKADDSNIP